MKKVLALFLSFVLLGSTCSVVVATTQTQSTVLYGDVSGDGVVSSADALMILQSVVGKIAFTSVQQHLGRVTAEVGAPDTADALEVLRHIVGKQPRFVREKEDIAIMLPTYSWEYTKTISDKYEQVQVIDTYDNIKLCVTKIFGTKPPDSINILPTILKGAVCL
ncbi:MAG: dockerin type I repeat-containing protein [Clostridia bacterium]|nr:dockerin type I repeat-containing protein [Clostridia bacterium]